MTRGTRHNDPTGEQELFDIALAEARTDVQPDPMADDLRGEAVMLIAVGWHDAVHVTIMGHRPGGIDCAVKLTTPTWNTDPLWRLRSDDEH
jgi:hypothetical protein